MKIVVVGSSNIDMVAQVKHLPTPGETVGDACFMQLLGGKGANQAVAAARLGASVTFITSLGNDMYADVLKKQFEKEGIVTDYVVDDVHHPTGTALILVADSGENCIAVAPGANHSLLPDSVTRFEAVIDEADIVVMQAEIPYETVKAVALLANGKGKRVLFNPAPACPIDRELMNAIDLLVVNEVEASFISGLSYTGDNLDEMATALMASGARHVIITLGSRGVYMKNKKETVRISGYKVNAVDTTAAGDTFCGALAVAYSQRGLDREALEFANVAAAIAVTRMGAQPSIPTLEEVGRFKLERKISLSFNL
ncbi:ribokinase [Bacteroides sp. KH569_7]|uniref:Ribokinase n=1 Tax=Bacteroides muris (ex Fokt et al. 2023) TaxID=2937417 RepID=A0A9X2NP70_9BACE|nr:ribokinase [Bacteroides muris (ex Fokt et al. 2023)]MCR6503365.1 ribokinase [Bacteroides muris (ex Fokt et al. 2023)]MCR6506636.1 ribokinase [Bacteroides muris (ex Fokt et al. 2023)]